MHEYFRDVPVSEQLDTKVQESLLQLRQETSVKPNKRRNRKWYYIAGTAVAACAAFIICCNVNPVLAAKVPLLGHIFEQVQYEVQYKGDYHENADNLQVTEDAGSFSKTSNGITVTLSEVVSDGQALYLAMEIKNEEKFPEEMMWKKNMPGYLLNYDFLTLKDTITFEGNDGATSVHQIQGSYVDDHTFAGIFQVDLSNLQNLAGENVTLPADYTMKLSITKIAGKLLSTNDTKRYDGTWDFTVPVSEAASREQTTTVEVNEANAQGVGITQVIKTPYTITTKMQLPTGADEADYFLVVCDANGDLLDYQSMDTIHYQTYGRDTTSVSVFVCDAIAYLEEYKGYVYSGDYETKRLTKTFAQYLSEHALYGTEVTF